MNKINWKTYETCYSEWLNNLSCFKRDLQIMNKNNNSFQKEFNFKRFKANVIDRKYNCTAGMIFDSKTNLYCDFNEWELCHKVKNSSNH